MDHVIHDHTCTHTHEILSTMENTFLAAGTFNRNENKWKNLKRFPHSSGFKDFFLSLPISMVDYKVPFQILGSRQEEGKIIETEHDPGVFFLRVLSYTLLNNVNQGQD